EPAARHIDFAADVKPLLAKSCFHCHGRDTQESGLRLDTRKSAFKGADSGPVIVPGKSAESRLIQMVAGLDKKVGRMPPEDDGGALNGKQVGILRAWIDQGAEWPAASDHDDAAAKSKNLWSLRPISRPRLPKVTTDSWVRNPIDAFILAKLEREQ